MMRSLDSRGNETSFRLRGDCATIVGVDKRSPDGFQPD